MRHRKKKLFRILCFLFAFFMLGGISLPVSSNNRFFTGDAELYYQTLIQSGFPSDYATALTELHLTHPNWSFVPLLITEQEPTYTWQYVLEQESKEPSNNLIYGSEEYKPYRHPLNFDVYDAGYYQVSTQGLAYFMDPRNFLNEADIFQFYDLSATQNASIEGIRAVLDGTFMEETRLENGYSYAEYFYEVGTQLGVDPVYLAVKARQEQGIHGTSPLISGKCGSLLASYYQYNVQYSEAGKPVNTPSFGYNIDELSALNGYYNFYNIGAGGNGLFEIYYNGMNRAKEGTPKMREQWGENAAWNTIWKSLYGGARIIKDSYVDRYQNTIYLQKFNVDSRAADRNFWGQYMQNVIGALSESRTLYSAFASIGVLDNACTFLIPVYKNMPSIPSPDPANGACSYTAIANTKYHYSVHLTLPNQYQTKASPLYLPQTAYQGETLQIAGYANHSYGILQMEYRWDNGDWIPFSQSGVFDLSFLIDFSAGSSHILTLRGTSAYDQENGAKKSNYHFLCLVMYVEVEEVPEVTLTLQANNKTEQTTVPAGSSISLPSIADDAFIGWCGSDGTLLPANSIVVLEEDLSFFPLFLNFEQLDGAALIFSDEHPKLRFYAALQKETYQVLVNLPIDLQILATIVDTKENILVKDAKLRGDLFAQNTNWVSFFADTDAITNSLLETSYSTDFSAVITYSNGEKKAFSASGLPFQRNAVEVATLALNDTDADYSQQVLNQLQAIIQTQ